LSDSGQKTRRAASHDNAAKLRAMLTAIEEAENVGELNSVPGWRLHPLKGNRRGVWSLKLTRNHRVTFRIANAAVSDVDVEDYH
jgi:proteic killer suppression protein